MTALGMDNGVAIDPDTRHNNKFLTRMEKEEIKEMRHGRMSTSEKLREWSANLLRLLLLFGVPVVLAMVLIIILVAIFVVRPYILTRDFTRTKCELSEHVILNESSASCSAGTDIFKPCVKVTVLYATGTSGKYESGILMENEQALVNCNPCSYTFGTHGLLHEYQDACESWKENYDPTLCVENFLDQLGVAGSVFPCYFNPNKPDEIVRDLVLDVNMMIHAVSWPILSCLIYLLAWGFVCYDAKQNRMINKCIREEIAYKRKRQQMARLHAAEWRKQKLGKTLGVRIEHSNGINMFAKNNESTKKLSLSLPSLCSLNDNHNVANDIKLSECNENIDTEDDENFNLHHLDLAVSQHNINGLVMTYENPRTHHSLSHKNMRFKDRYQAGSSHHTLPVLSFSPMSTFCRPKYNGNSLLHQNVYNFAYSSFSAGDRHKTKNSSKLRAAAILQSFPPVLHTNGRMFYQEKKLNSDSSDSDAVVSEDDIDGYYSFAQRQKDLPMQTVDMYSGKDESNV
uniref:uncharacterized protein LOC120342114 n=1 Tax=Styela clava TaxID=7725 RepID=UPI00193A5BCE|nr:uncharacterized protein LOC120342114 [Styela clava]